MWKGQPEVWVRAGGYFTPFGHSLFCNRRNYFPIANSTSQFFKWFLGDENVQLSIAFVPFPDLTSYLKNKTPTHICWQKKPSAHFWQCSFYEQKNLGVAHCCSLLQGQQWAKNLGVRNQISRKSQLISKLFHNQLQTSGHVLEGMLHLPWVVIHHMKPDQVDYWQLQGFQDWCIYTRFRIGFTFDTNPE